MLGIMEGRDVPGVARVIAESFSNLVVSRDPAAPAWETAALNGVASIVTAYDVCRTTRDTDSTRRVGRRIFLGPAPAMR